MALSPTQELQQIIRQKDRWLITGPEKVIKLLRELRKQVLDEIGRAAISGWQQHQLKETLAAIERAADDYTRRIQAELGIDLRKFWDLGQESVYKPLNAGGVYTGFNISRETLNVLSDFTYHKIAGVTGAAFDKIKAELTLGVLGGKTPQQVAEAVGAQLNGPSIFASIEARAETIAKTELGRVYSMAAEQRRQQAADYVDGLVKIWDHAGHPRNPRWSHLAVHGQEVPVGEPFKLRDENGYRLMYPHDPNAHISEVINCGCDAVTWKQSWGERPEGLRKAA